MNRRPRQVVYQSEGFGAIRHRMKTESLRLVTAPMIVEKGGMDLEQGGIRISSLGSVRVVLGHLDATWRSPECIDAVVSSGGDSSGLLGEANRSSEAGCNCNYKDPVSLLGPHACLFVFAIG